MTEISLERRAEIRHRLRKTGSMRRLMDDEIAMEITVGELRALLNHADERVEALDILRMIWLGVGLPFGRIETLLQRAERRTSLESRSSR